MTRKRWLELAPGLAIWTTFVAAMVFSYLAPLQTIIFIIIFDLYWLFRIVYFVVALIKEWINYRRDSKRAWFDELSKLDGWQRYRHVVFVPFVKEPAEVLIQTLNCLKNSSYPIDKLSVVVAGEERVKDHFESVKSAVEKEFAGVFGNLWFTMHPKDLPDEIPGKGSNLNFAGQKVAPLVAALGVPAEDVIVSSFDSDTCVPREYFAYLTYLYHTVPNPTRASYQPIPLFNNNMWDAPAPIRVAAFGTTFWLLSELGRPDAAMTFSSHSMPWKMLLDVGFWQKDIVSEDSRIFLQGLIRYNGDYRVEPMYMGVNLDAVEGKSYLDSLKALYKQQRRWAWGVEHFPFMVEAFKKAPLMPRSIKWRFIFFHFEGMFTWATAPILIFILGRLPLYVASSSSDALVQSAPYTLQIIMRLAMVGVLASFILSFFLLPHRPPKHSRFKWLVMLFQWILLPVTFLLFGAFPAIDAQTRLMLGKYLGFNVTVKKRN